MRYWSRRGRNTGWVPMQWIWIVASVLGMLVVLVIVSQLRARQTPVVPVEASIVPPVPQDGARIAIMGDVRTKGLEPPPIFGTIVGALDQAKPGLVLSLGDLINSDTKPAVVAQQWDRFMAAAQPLVATRPFRPCLGNHETNGNTSSLSVYLDRFDLPKNGPAGFEELTFSFDWELAHFVCLSTELPGSFNQLGSAQLDWLEKDLAATKQPFVFVYAHDPAYPVGPHIGQSLDVHPAERDRLWSILKAARVTAYLAGHEHLYNRKDVDGLTQVIIGTSGSNIQGGFGGEFQHYGLLDLTPSSAVLRVYDEAGVLRDQATFPARQN